MANRNQRVIAIAIVVVAAIAVGIGLFALGRAMTAPPSSGPTPAVTPTIADPSPTYEPTNVDGSPEPALPQGEAVAGKGGAKAGPTGLPLGYAHDETGAISAATNYLIWMNSLRIANKSDADAMATVAAADVKTRKTLIESFDLLRSGMGDLTSDQPEPARGAYAVAEYSSSRATVYIWSPEVTTTAAGQTDHVWSIDGVVVRWVNNDWKLDGGLITRSGAAAIDPVDPAGNPSAKEKNAILHRTPADPGEISDVADQSWHEYGNAPH